jgi:hypothetical protein
MTLSRVPAVTGAVAALCVLVAAAAAYGATSINFSGTTSQGRPISFTLAGNSITNLDYRINDKCPDGTTLFVHNYGFSPLKIKKSKFGGKFGSTNGNTTAIVSGRVSGNTVSGTLSDKTRSKRTGLFCTGKATFKLTHRPRRSDAGRR